MTGQRQPWGHAHDPHLREAVTLIGGWHGPRHAALLDDIRLACPVSAAVTPRATPLTAFVKPFIFSSPWSG